MEDLEGLREAYIAARRAYEAALRASSPFHVGAIIRSATGKLAKVTSVQVHFGKLMIAAVQQKNDGTFGRRRVDMWQLEWRDPQLHSRPDAGA